MIKLLQEIDNQKLSREEKLNLSIPGLGKNRRLSFGQAKKRAF